MIADRKHIRTFIRHCIIQSIVHVRPDSVRVKFAIDDAAASIAIDQKGRIVIGGFSGVRSVADGTLSADFLVLRYTTSGKLDKSFGNAGISGALVAGSSHNLIGVGGGLANGLNGNKVGINNPKLAPLGNFGGPTQTMMPLAGSPALDAGGNSHIPPGVFTDQRGLPANLQRHRRHRRRRVQQDQYLRASL